MKWNFKKWSSFSKVAILILLLGSLMFIFCNPLKEGYKKKKKSSGTAASGTTAAEDTADADDTTEAEGTTED
jgi:hypothetical protein